MTDTSDQIESDAPPSEVKQPGTSKSRGKRIGLSVLIVVIVVGAVLFTWYVLRGKYYENTNDARIQADAVTISSRVNGYVADVFVADNEDVHAGQQIVRIEQQDYKAQVAQIEAQIAQAKASTDAAEAAIGEQDAAIDEARAQLAASRAKAEHDVGEVRRYQPLVQAGAERREELVDRELTATQSAESVHAQAAALEASQRRIISLQAQIRQAEAQGKAAEAQLAASKVQISETVLRAPVDGRVGSKTVMKGQLALPGTRMMTIVPRDKLYVVANFKETQLALMRPGQPATIAVDALDGLKLGGKISSVSPGTGAQFSLLPPQNASGNFTKVVQRVPVRVELVATPEARKLLVPGLSVTVSVDTISAKGELDRIGELQRRLLEGRH